MPHLQNQHLTIPPFLMIHIDYSLRERLQFLNRLEEEEINYNTPFVSVLQYVCRSHNRVIEIAHVEGIEEGIIIIIIKHRLSGGSIKNLDDLVERVQPVAKLTHLCPEHRILSLNAQILLRGDVDACENLLILFPQLSHLRNQIVQVFLLPHARSSRRFPIRYHSLPLPLIHHRLQILLRTRVLKLSRRPRTRSTR